VHYFPFVLWILLTFLCGMATTGSATESLRKQVEVDWLKQAEALGAWRNGFKAAPSVIATWTDAAGAVDGVKDGEYAFHTGHEPNPWWQIDLGEPTAIARIVVYNRLDYEPGLHNADNLIIHISDDGKDWRRIYDNRGKHFGGISGAPPLAVTFAPEEVRARFVRLQIRSDKPIFFHLDEVEIYSPGDPNINIALGRSADQSSLSRWSTVKVPATKAQPISYPIAFFVDRGRQLVTDLRASGVDTQLFDGQLNELATRLEKMPEDASADAQRELYFQVRWVVRRLAFANPLVDFDRLLFVKRFTQQTYPDICLNHMPWVARPGGDICILDNPFSPDGTSQRVSNVIDGKLGPGHVHGMDLWFDGDRIVFGYAKAESNEPPVKPWPPAFCAARNVAHQLRETVEPTHIFEIRIDGDKLRQVTNHDYWSDLDPTYLPNGDIAFVSERCAYELQCNHTPRLDETSCNLYVMRLDGSNIRRLSVNKDGDYLPHCLDDGTIGYTRWEYQERNLTQIQSLWIVRPDGTWADALFKQHLNDPWALEDVRSVPGTGNRKHVAIAAGHHTLAAGPVVVITPSGGMNDPKAIRIVTPGVVPPEGGMSGSPVAEGGVRDDGGHYMNPWALSEKYYLAAYSYQKEGPEGFPSYYRGMDETGYALYLIDVFGNKELIYRDPNISSSVPIPLRPRTKPPIVTDVTDASKQYAVCSVSDIGHGVEGIDSKTIRHIRIAHRIPWPYDRKHGGKRYEYVALNSGVNWTPVRIIGDVPVEADGSAHFTVPVDTPVYFQLLDENHMELRRMRSFVSFQPGEQRACVGCHESRGVAPTDTPMPLALMREPSNPVPMPWGDETLSFLRDVQPVFDRHCVRCHSGLKPAGELDFSGGLVEGAEIRTWYGRALRLDGHNRAYRTLLEHGLVSYANKYDPADVVTQPLTFGSHKSKLIEALRNGACAERTKLDDEDWLRLVGWIDANVPYHDEFINMRPEQEPYDLPADRELAARIAAVHVKRCAACHEANEITRFDWIDLREPQRSLFLSAPLPVGSGGSGKCGKAVYDDENDPDYQAVLQLVRTAVDQAWQRPRRDVRALAPPHWTRVASSDSRRIDRRRAAMVHASDLAAPARRISEGAYGCLQSLAYTP